MRMREINHLMVNPFFIVNNFKLVAKNIIVMQCILARLRMHAVHTSLASYPGSLIATHAARPRAWVRG